MQKNCGNQTDEEIVKLIGEDPDFYYCLVERYEEKMARYVRRLTNVPKETVEDLVQEIFLKAYENINDFDPDLKFSSWLYRIAHNHAISFWRKNKNERKIFSWDADENLKNFFEAEDDLAEELQQKMTGEKISEMIMQLDPIYRNVLVLKYWEDKSYEEISDILRKPVGTVGTLILRAKAEFKKRIKKHIVNL